ncbi:MAG: SUMF1/EgtB/PvdO family nonheme iron enzyme [Alloprevotella sp.]|nr:SUMF1/EgtB/PvdO family nonheme iron enzyme [Alloprevotella sp.]
MKCPHCGQEHPDNFQFCPMTGQRIALQYKACTNEQCPDFGKYILPLDSRFCPSCGKALEDQMISEKNSKLEFEVDGVSFNMILVEHGQFLMGATDEQENPDDEEKPVHKVVLTKDYYIGETQVTQALWTAIMGDNPSCYDDEEDKPVESVSWIDCQKFIRALNRKLRSELGEKKFRLPTEAEWEFAARGGNKSEGYQYAGSDEIDDVAWYADNAGADGTNLVAELEANELGLYDMCGNVDEWCQDWYEEYSYNPQINPTGPCNGDGRVIRGGNFCSPDNSCRLSYRDLLAPDEDSFNLGFRIVLSE